MARAGKPLMPLDDAWAQLRTAVEAHVASPHRREVERVRSDAALGRVLACDLVSSVDVPPHDNSAMDGYAVRAADLAVPGELPVSQRVAAGEVGVELPPGHGARIFTGAPIPPGADAVVMQEQVQPGQRAGHVRFEHAVQAGQNIRRRGEDIARGHPVLRAGQRLGPAGLGVAASVGAEVLDVWPRPRVALLTTGNELVMPGQTLPPGAIYNSNRHTLLGLTQSVGAEGSDLGIVPDQLDTTRRALASAAERHDLILTSGGVSVGEEDHLRAAVEAEGEMLFWALAIKPGKPFVFGRIHRADGSACLYMGLPGNPVASYVTFLLLVRPILDVLAGAAWQLPQGLSLPAAFEWPRADTRREFLRARLGRDGRVELYPHQGSGVLSSAAWADGLVDLPAGQTVRPGDAVTFLPTAELLAPSAAWRQG